MPFIWRVLINAHTCVTQILIKWGLVPSAHEVPSCSCPIRTLSHNRQLLFWFFATKDNFACPRFSYEWNHTVCTFLCLAFFLRFIRVVAGISSWLLFNCWVAFQCMRMPQFTYLNVSMDVWFGPSFCSVSFLIADLFVNSDLTFDLDLTLTWIMNWVPTLTWLQLKPCFWPYFWPLHRRSQTLAMTILIWFYTLSSTLIWVLVWLGPWLDPWHWSR